MSLRKLPCRSRRRHRRANCRALPSVNVAVSAPCVCRAAPLSKLAATDVMAPEAEGVEHLLCATCQQPAKLQCPRWCARKAGLCGYCWPWHARSCRCRGVSGTQRRCHFCQFGWSGCSPAKVGPRCSSAGSPLSQHFAAFRCWPSPLPLPASLELGLEKDLAAFCSQECFKGSWTEHKKLHKPSATEGWHYCTRRGQVRRGLLAAVEAACCC